MSSLCRDADMSKLYMDGIDELRLGQAREYLGKSGERTLEVAARGYLNRASRLLELEEEGHFKFWDGHELAALVRNSGFKKVESRPALGSPSQAVVVSAIKA